MSTEVTRGLILLAEDDEDHAALVRIAVEAAGVSADVEWVPDGARALERLRGTGPFAGAPRPDVMLLDLKLPSLDGHEVLAAAKADPALRGIPIVVLSTSQSNADRARAYAAHANGYLSKPLDYGQLTGMLRAFGEYWLRWNLGSGPADTSDPARGQRGAEPASDRPR